MPPLPRILFSLLQAALVLFFFYLFFSKRRNVAPAISKVFFFDVKSLVACTYPLEIQEYNFFINKAFSRNSHFFLHQNKCFHWALFRDCLYFFNGLYPHRKRTIPRNIAIF